jgi:hypothetical protein
MSGDIIHVKTGTYTEINQISNLPSGVSIEGDGITSNLIGANIILSGSGGNQHISKIQIDGNNTEGFNAILIQGRNNVTIDNCKFINFKTGAKHFATESFEYVIEIRNSTNSKIHHNIIEGGVRAFEFSTLQIYNNTIGKPTMASDPETGIYLSGISNVHIYNNYFKNLAMQIELVSWGISVMNDVYINNNVMTNIGVTSGDCYGSGIVFEGLTSTTCRNLNVVGNTMVANPGSRSTMIGIWLPTIGNARKIIIRNNIITGFKYASIFAAGPEPRMDSVFIENNILFGNAIAGVKVDSATNLPYYTNVPLPIHNSQKNLIVSDPLLISGTDFHISNQSPGIGMGIPTSWITEDFEGGVIFDPPNIGAYGGTLTTGIEPPKIYNDSVLIYPNPTTNYINIKFFSNQFDPTRIQIYNLSGNMMIDKKMDILDDDIIYSLQFNLKSGIYIVKISNQENKLSVSKIIVK